MAHTPARTSPPRTTMELSAPDTSSALSGVESDERRDAEVVLNRGFERLGEERARAFNATS